MTSTTTDERTTAKPFRVALGVCGGIAAYKAAEVLRGLQKAGCEVRVSMTGRATEFVTPLTFRALSGAHVVTDDYAPDNPDPIAHITFSQTIDLLVVAPATANTLAKFAAGIADDFLTSTYLAATAPVVVAPAMNTTMWRHPATRRNIELLLADGVHVVEPDAGIMACGTTGPGRLAEPDFVVAEAMKILRRGRARGVEFSNDKNLADENPVDSNPIEDSSSGEDLVGERVLITAGGTREDIDPVRFISNRSSGRMGFALAEAATARGARVTLVCGTVSATPPAGASIRLVSVTTAAEMHAAVMKEIDRATIFISAAAVADYRPTRVTKQKIKKTDEAFTLRLEPTADILADVARAPRLNGSIVVGFAAETENVVAHAQEKLRRKNLDLIVANDITQPGAGFDSETNVVTIISRRDDAPIALPMLPKRLVADRVLDEATRLRTSNSDSDLSDSVLSQAAQPDETFAT